MNCYNLLFALVIILSACTPDRYSQPDMHPRCKEWGAAYDRIHGDQQVQRDVEKQLSVTDRFQYYACIHVTSVFFPPEPVMFIDDAQQFLDLIPALLSGNIQDYQLCVMARICAKIAEVKPQLIKQYSATIFAIEDRASRMKSNWKSNTVRYLDSIKQVLRSDKS